MDNLVKADTLFGKRVNVIGNISADLVLESLGKVYIKSRNKALTLEEFITNLIGEDFNVSTSKVKIVEGIENLDTSEFKDGTFIFDKLSKILYLYLDNDLLELINVAPEGDGYVKRSGDTMTGRLSIYVKNGPPLYVNSANLVENLNALYLNGETADKFTRRHKDEKISGSWTFLKTTTFDQGVRIYKDAVLHGSIGSPNFSSGFGGYGWRMDADTNTLTVDNLVVRKLMLVYELVVNKISATNGSLWVSNAGKVTDVCKLLIKPYSFFSNTHEYLLFCSGLQDDFIKLTTEITNESLEAEAFSTSSGDNIEIKLCWSKNTLENAKFIHIKQKGGNYTGQYFDNLNATNYSIYPLFSEDFKFNVVFPIITRNNYQIFTANTKRIEELKEYIKEHQNYSLEVLLPYYDTLDLYERVTVPLNFVSFVLPYYKYFANGDYYLVTFDGDSLPVFKPGDILRCLKWTYGGIKYYDAVVCNQIGSKYIILLAPSFLDLKTTINYDKGIEPTVIQDVDSNNESLYKSTSKYENTNNPLGQVEIDDSLVLIGNIWNGQRQNGVYITSTDDAAPYMDVLSGINRPDYSVIYYIPIYNTFKLYKSQYNLKAFVGYNNLVEIPYTGDYYILDSSKENFTCEYVCFLHNNTIYLATGKVVPNVAGVEILHYLNTTPDRYTIFGKELDISYIILENDGKIKLENTDGNLIQEKLLESFAISSTRNTKARFGKLDGIQDELFPMNKLPYGYGLYGLNVFLTGEFYLSNGLAVADIGKEAIAFAVASSLAVNNAVNILREDMIKADNLIKASYYSKGTLQTAGMRIAEDAYGNPGIVIWGNKLLFATTDDEFNGYVPPTLLLEDGKIRGKYLSVDEALGTRNATVPESSFQINGVNYNSLDTVRVYRDKIQKTSLGHIYYEDSNNILYIRKFLVGTNEVRWLIVNPDGYPRYKNLYDEYTSVEYFNFNYYDLNGNNHSYTNGIIPSDIELYLINDYSLPLKVWELHRNGEGNLGGSTLYWNSSGKTVVSGILYGKEGNIGGLLLSENNLFTLHKDQYGNYFNPFLISNRGYGFFDSRVELPSILLTSMDLSNIIRNRTMLSSRGLYYLENTNTYSTSISSNDYLTLQVPAVLFTLTIIPVEVSNLGQWTLYARLACGQNVFSRVNMNWGEGHYAINFPLMESSNSDYLYLRNWFSRKLVSGEVHFIVSGINLAISDQDISNPDSYYNVRDMLINDHSFLVRDDMFVKATIGYVHFSGNHLFGPISLTDYSRMYLYSAAISRTEDGELMGTLDSGGVDYIGSNTLFAENSFKNIILINTADDNEANWGGFNLTALYTPTYEDYYMTKTNVVTTNYNLLEESERIYIQSRKRIISNTYGANGSSHNYLIETLNETKASMTDSLLLELASTISEIETSISNMAYQADNISDYITREEIDSLETNLNTLSNNILESIWNLDTSLPPIEDDTEFVSFINNITGSKIDTVLKNVISSELTPQTYSYLKSGYNYVKNTSNATKSWMLANMLAELTPYVKYNTATPSDEYYKTLQTEVSGDTATNYFVNASYSYGGLKLDYLDNEQTYMDRIEGAVYYAKFKNADFSGLYQSAENARIELRNKGISLAIRVNDTDSESNSTYTGKENPKLTKNQVVHMLPLIPDSRPSNSPNKGDWLFTLSMITQYPTSSSLPRNYEALKDKNVDTEYFCKILGLTVNNKNLYYLWKCNDIGDLGCNQIKTSFDRLRPGVLNNKNISTGGSGFTIPSGGSVYLCDCAVELANDVDSFKDDNGLIDCSTTNNGTTYCDRDIENFTKYVENGSGSNQWRSYASGHSARAFTILLLTIEAYGDSMNVDGYTSRTTRILQYCINRAVMRAHWKTDTIAGRYAASVLIGLLNGFNEFKDEIDKVL